MRLGLRVDSPDEHIVTGAAVAVTLDGEDVSRYVRRVVLTVDTVTAIEAEVTFYLSDVDVDVPSVITPLIDEARDTAALESVSQSR